MQKTDFMNTVSRFKYTVNMMCRKLLLLVQKQFSSMQKNRFNYCEIQPRKSIQIWHINLENTISLGVLFENMEQLFKQGAENNFRRKECEEFENNAGQKIILQRMLELVCAENNE